MKLIDKKRRKIEKILISDLPDECKCFADIENFETSQDNGHGVKRENVEITVYKTLDNSSSSKTTQVTKFLLVQKLASRNGLILYEYDETKIGVITEPLAMDSFWRVIYHNVKSFYHKHEFHDDENDSILNPYMGYADINAENNNALKHYLQEYEIKFKNLYETRYDSTKGIKDKLISPHGGFDKFINDFFSKAWVESFYEIEGQYIYYKTLAESIYHNPELSACDREIARDLHRIKLNTKHYYNRVVLIKTNLEIHFERFKSVSSEKISIGSYDLGLRSIILGAWSIILGSWSFILGAWSIFRENTCVGIIASIIMLPISILFYNYIKKKNVLKMIVDKLKNNS